MTHRRAVRGHPIAAFTHLGLGVTGRGLDNRPGRLYTVIDQPARVIKSFTIVATTHRAATADDGYDFPFLWPNMARSTVGHRSGVDRRRTAVRTPPSASTPATRTTVDPNAP
jgi:hypothetical protein